jgi:hypothetical protein
VLNCYDAGSKSKESKLPAMNFHANEFFEHCFMISFSRVIKTEVYCTLFEEMGKTGERLFFRLASFHLISHSTIALQRVAKLTTLEFKN